MMSVTSTSQSRSPGRPQGGVGVAVGVLVDAAVGVAVLVGVLVGVGVLVAVSVGVGVLVAVDVFVGVVVGVGRRELGASNQLSAITMYPSTLG